MSRHVEADCACARRRVWTVGRILKATLSSMQLERMHEGSCIEVKYGRRIVVFPEEPDTRSSSRPTGMPSVGRCQTLALLDHEIVLTNRLRA
jgi:hypothetical protein